MVLPEGVLNTSNLQKIREYFEGKAKIILICSIPQDVFIAAGATVKPSLVFFKRFTEEEGRKQQIYNLFAEYCKFDRQMVVATHSPILAQLANEKELLMLDHEGGKSTLLTEEKIDKIKHLTGTSWDVIGQGMMLKSNRPLVVFEGKTDVKYVKRAIDLLKNDNPSYDQLQVDFMSAGGADNMQFFITDLLEVIPNSKKVIVFFDRDNEGQTGAATLLNLTTSDESIAHYDDVKQNNLTVSFIPYKTGVTGGDYFMWDEILPLAEKKSPVSPATPEVKKPVTVKDSKSLHDEIKEKLVAIGELLGFDSRSEVKIATGAVVDAVWEAKIGNMGKAIYVFEVQSKGSIDSLILNLKKAQSNAAVQAVVAVADEEQLAKIIQESAGVIDEKSLRTWDCEDVLAVYDALVRAHESINKLALVPESF